ncbi:MAG: acyl-CoA dehydrogenase [Microcella sp.]|uniref:acyl-CoA dehydrogenase n=1 Tax=Microcella sp. TaxID=1913979 RepID=UPI00271D5CA7|nr:acyl-CoA dehydrogenase [Microcella sp.]MDO8338558.1 acyl-CoA dehydrogenase [Microcella sp.]
MRVRLTSDPAAGAGPRAMLVERLAPRMVPDALATARDLGVLELEAVERSAAREPVAEALLDRWEALATLAAVDLGAARVVEPHLDALGILAEAAATDDAGPHDPDRAAVWGVFAAEGGDEPLRARPVGDGWRLDGVKPWCSLAGILDRALVTAHVDDAGTRRLFAVDLRAPGVAVDEGAWAARGLSEIPSGPVRFTEVAAEPVGADGWYLQRPGFAIGGMGVAACWFGGAVGLARTLHAALVERSDPHALAHLGAIDEQLEAARLVFADAARRAPGADRATARILAKRVRATVARTCDDVLARTARALGPAPLALDAEHAKRVADLQLYVRQHHAERDLASLGEALTASEAPW